MWNKFLYWFIGHNWKPSGFSGFLLSSYGICNRCLIAKVVTLNLN